MKKSRPIHSANASAKRIIEKGLRGIPSQPVMYISSEGHHSIQKSATLCGLGKEAVREIAVNEHFQLNYSALVDQIEKDRKQGFTPFLIVATAGTTSAGAIDPIERLAQYAATQNIWLHVDAAWGGAALLVPELRPLLQGIEHADSITFNPHKWLSIPMGAGLFLTRHRDILTQTFKVTTPYMPSNGLDDEAHDDPFTRSMQWARRFIGLKVFLSLAVAGWSGYETEIRRQVSLGDYLRTQLTAAGWQIINDSPLPVVCFMDPTHPQGRAYPYLKNIAARVVSAGNAWISTSNISSLPALRACVTNYRTAERDVDMLINELSVAREY